MSVLLLPSFLSLASSVVASLAGYLLDGRTNHFHPVRASVHTEFSNSLAYIRGTSSHLTQEEATGRPAQSKFTSSRKDWCQCTSSTLQAFKNTKHPSAIAVPEWYLHPYTQSKD